MSYSDDLDWLARNVHEWPGGDRQPWCYVYFKCGERAVSGNCITVIEPCVRIEKCAWLARRAELQNKPGWAGHQWPQIFQNEDGHWFGARAGWDFKSHIGGGWKGEGVSLLRDDGEYLQSGEILGDWRDTLERRPVDLSEPAVTERLTEATKTVLAAVPNLLGEQFKFERNTKPVSVSNEIMQLDQPVAVADTGDAGSANAWRSLHEWIEDEANNPQMALMKQVSAELHNDGCHSAWIHVSRFIEALFERIDDLETMTDSIPGIHDEQPWPDATWYERGELPPVGTKCEYRLSTTSPWYSCEIKYVIRDDGVVMMREDGFEQFCSINSKLQPVSFRPIRTERDDAIEAMKDHCPYPGSRETTYRLFAESLYDAGYRAGCSE